MTTVHREVCHIVWMICLGIVVLAVVLVRGPVRDAAWSDACADLAAGKSIAGHWNTIEPCRDVRPNQP